MTRLVVRQRYGSLVPLLLIGVLGGSGCGKGAAGDAGAVGAARAEPPPSHAPLSAPAGSPADALVPISLAEAVRRASAADSAPAAAASATLDPVPAPVYVDAPRIARAAVLTRRAYDAYAAVLQKRGNRRDLEPREVQGALRMLDSATGVYPWSPEVYLLRARVLRSVGDLRGAWSNAETASRLGRRREGEALAAMIDLADRDTVGAVARSAKLLAEVRAAPRPLNAREGRYIALALVMVGNRTGAVEVLGRIDPNNAELRRVLQDPELVALGGSARLRARAASRTR